MGNIDKEGLKKVLEDVRIAHQLMYEYYKRIQNIIDFLSKNTKQVAEEFYYPYTDKKPRYDLFTVYFLGRDDNKKKANAFHVILVNNSSLELGYTQEAKSELIFLFDEDDLILKERNWAKDKNVEEIYLEIIREKYKKQKEECHDEVKKIEEKKGHIQRINIGDLDKLENLQKIWDEYIKKLPPCWLNNGKTNSDNQ